MRRVSPLSRSRAVVLCCMVIPVTIAGCAGDRPISTSPQPQDATLRAIAAPPANARLVQRLATREPVTAGVLRVEPRPVSDLHAARVVTRARALLDEGIVHRTTGEATFYADYFEGRRTASGIRFRQRQMYAAHRFYPFGTVLRVTNLRNQRSVEVRVVDRGPFGTRALERNTILDVSRGAAEQLGFVAHGRTPIRIDVLSWGGGDRAG